MLCHELRAPLGAIQNALNVLRSPTGQERAIQERMHALIERQVRQLTRLTAGVLDLSRSAGEPLPLQRERIDLRTVITDAIETLEWELQQRGHRLELALPSRPVWVRGDAGRLQQVFLNLLANAVKYTDAGGELTVSVQQQEHHVEVRLRDSGIGITSDELPFIFDLYRRADHGAAGNPYGLGIGLALVRTLVGLHGGHVRASSAGAGQGSEFTVRLPLVS